MKNSFCTKWALLVILVQLPGLAAERFVDANGLNPTAPFETWATAAINIQDAIDASADGDVVWVTNGIYAAGGKVAAGDLTNRVVLDKAVTVQSVNGPLVTIIQGANATNGPSGLRCAWLGAGATLSGFTLQGGSTRTAGDTATLQSGGGAWCANRVNAIVANCRITGNSAAYAGGGVYQGLVKNSAILTNYASSAGGASLSTLHHCTVIGNVANGAAGISGGAATNCIIYFNSSKVNPTNYAAASMSHSCSTPLASGAGNVSADPLLLSGSMNLANASPCRGAGLSGISSGTDLFGHSWSNPPSMGCAEWQARPIIGHLAIEFAAAPVGFTLSASVAGLEPFTYLWLRDGEVLSDNGRYASTDSATLRVKGIEPMNPGGYQLVASNAFGAGTSAVFQVTAHYVNASATAPVPPYSTWETAAGTIQEAIDVAAPGSLILVTNGVYDRGGKVMSADLTNRIAIHKPLLVHAVNGAQVTTLLGSWQPNANGPAAVRCAWLTNGAMVSGFTIQGGATRTSSTTGQEMNGGGVWGTTNAIVAECVLVDNMAQQYGGGAYQVSLFDSTLLRNRALGLAQASGGGAYGSSLQNCTLAENWATLNGGGAMNCRLKSCLLTGNTADSYGGAATGGSLVNCTVVSNISSAAVSSATLTNCIVYHNRSGYSPLSVANHYQSTFRYSCSVPLPPGVANTAADPLLVGDGFHLAETSPCRGAGLLTAVAGLDLDGQQWATPPSMGCDEWRPEPSIPLPIETRFSRDPFTLTLSAASAAGQTPLRFWWYRDGELLENDAHYSGADGPVLSVDPFEPEDAGNYRVIASNSYGMATSVVARVVVHCVDVAASVPTPPYSTWAAAANTIQDAVDVAEAGDIVLVAEGVYATGGKIVAGDLLNRVAITRPLTVTSVNGPANTIIHGQQEPGSGAGPSAERCAWLADGVLLSGFTLQEGGTRTGTVPDLASGGGAFAFSTKAVLYDCVLRNNVAGKDGGGCSMGLLDRCVVEGNQSAGTGGALVSSTALNTLIRANSASRCGGVEMGNLYNCTVTENASGSFGAGIFGGTIRNCIVWSNSVNGNSAVAQWALIQSAHSCTTPLLAGNGNINADPQLRDGKYLSPGSPCIGAGNDLFALGTDLEGKAWSSPPSMGCLEYEAAPVILVEPALQLTTAPVGFVLSATVQGNEPLSYWWVHEGELVEDGVRYVSSGTPTLIGRNLDAFHAGSYQLIASNAFGIVTSAVVWVQVHCVDPDGTSPATPYSTWETAANNIQDAVDAALPGAIVLVTNGIYAQGGKIADGDLLNRLVLDKAVLVQSMNGPEVTIIEGARHPGATNGTLAARCAWMTNGAVLSGFTLRGGATREAIGSETPQQSGGGVWGYSNAVVAGCRLLWNAASFSGGAAYGVALQNCTLEGNVALGTSLSGSGVGGGACQATLRNCFVQYNRAPSGGGGLYSCAAQNSLIRYNSTLGNGAGAAYGSAVNCTITANYIELTALPVAQASGGGSYFVDATNSIIYANRNNRFPTTSSSNYAGGAFSYCCTLPLPSGQGNIGANPQLLADGCHITSSSPCRGTGASTAGSGLDLDGQPWNTPPAIGCDEWSADPVFLFNPSIEAAGPVGQLRIKAGDVFGDGPFTYYWFKDGLPLEESLGYESVYEPTLIVTKLGPEHAGLYQLLASNSTTATSALVGVVVRCVRQEAGQSSPPYATWTTAAHTIQEAADICYPGDFILVTNGVYASGGRVASGSLANRVVLENPVTLLSVNGPEATVIQGAWDPVTTNGPAAVRCVWLGRLATLNGFTLADGATLASGLYPDQAGGGVYTEFFAQILNCIITNNCAADYGGGAAGGALLNSTIVGNRAGSGGGLYSSYATNCPIAGNAASSNGGGIYEGRAVHCNIVNNWAGNRGGGVYNLSWGNPLYLNTIIYYNRSGFRSVDNFYGNMGPVQFCCTEPAAPGTGNIVGDPQLIDNSHIAFSSPCRAAGKPLDSFPSDVDGDLWANPPSIGCDEPQNAGVSGPITVALHAGWPGPRAETVQNADLMLYAAVTGSASRFTWSFGDATPVAEGSSMVLHRWTNSGDYIVTFTAYNADYAQGVSATLPVHVVPLATPVLGNPGVSSGEFVMSLFGQPGVYYQFEQATNLAPPAVWKPAATVLGRDTLESLTFPKSGTGSVFYRVRIE